MREPLDPPAMYVDFRNKIEISFSEKITEEMTETFQVLTEEEPFYALLSKLEKGNTDSAVINARYYDFLEAADILQQVLQRVSALSAYGRKKEARRLYDEILPEASRHFTNAFLLWQASGDVSVKTGSNATCA